MYRAATNPAYLWRVPGKPVSVNLSAEVIHRLGLLVREGVLPGSHRGLETGGLLLGRTERTGTGTMVEVEDFEPIECEHAAGPSFLLSRPDRKRLEEQMRRLGTGRGLSIVGMFRTHTRKSAAVTVEDVDLMYDYLAKPSNVFLLIRAPADGPPTAGFVIWEGRQIRSLTPYVEFPLQAVDRPGWDEDGLRPTARAAREQPAVGDAQADRADEPAIDWYGQGARVLRRAKASLPQLQVKEVLSRRFGPRERTGLALAAAALSIAALAGVVDRNQKRPAAAFPKPGLATAAPNAQALEEGAALPEPASIPELAVATTRQASASLGGLSEEPGRRKTASPAMPGESTGRRTFVPAVSPPQAELEIPEPPTIAGAGAIEAGPTLGKDIVGVPRLSIPAAPDAFVRVTVDPVLPTRRWGRLGKLGLGGKGEKRTVFFPPTPVHRPATDVPPELSRRIGRNVPVDVKVYVDREGKVAYAELLSDAAGLDRDLVTLAVFSSRRWQFAPAQSDGENVAAEVVLRYRFGAGDR